jgi:hypothetical protein
MSRTFPEIFCKCRSTRIFCSSPHMKSSMNSPCSSFLSPQNLSVHRASAPAGRFEMSHEICILLPYECCRLELVECMRCMLGKTVQHSQFSRYRHSIPQVSSKSVRYLIKVKMMTTCSNELPCSELFHFVIPQPLSAMCMLAHEAWQCLLQVAFFHTIELSRVRYYLHFH